MNYDEIWGIAFPRVSEFFSGQTKKEDECSFRYGEALIALEPLPDRHLGSMVIAQTRVRITGGTDADEIHRRFNMCFLSAGG